jgi:hypothetical protein
MGREKDGTMREDAIISRRDSWQLRAMRLEAGGTRRRAISSISLPSGPAAWEPTTSIAAAGRASFRFGTSTTGGPPACSNFDHAGPLTKAVVMGDLAVRFPGRKLEWDEPNVRVTNLEEVRPELLNLPGGLQGRREKYHPRMQGRNTSVWCSRRFHPVAAPANDRERPRLPRVRAPLRTARPLRPQPQ